MPQPCKICEHPQREAIEAELSGSWERGLRSIGDQYGVSKDSLSRHSQAHMRLVEGGDQVVADSSHRLFTNVDIPARITTDCQVVEGTTGAESAPPAEREYQDFLRQWERRSWIAPAQLQAAFLVEFNADRASKLSGLLDEAVERGDLVQRAGLYFRTDQLTSWLNASDATA
jgi:hypothetical protein